VLDLYARTRALLGDVPLLLEWDSDLPTLPALVAEARRAACWPSTVQAESRHAG
jgi:uncharacterized protein (UPF0276 family)